jgi:hypothetical protein
VDHQGRHPLPRSRPDGARQRDGGASAKEVKSARRLLKREHVSEVRGAGGSAIISE